MGLIKREDAIERMVRFFNEEDMMEDKMPNERINKWRASVVFEDIPSVEPTIEIDADQLRKLLREGWTIHSEPNQGEWIDENNNIVPFDKDGCPRGWCKCSKCGDYLSASDEYAVRGFFCPNCGCRMKGADDE